MTAETQGNVEKPEVRLHPDDWKAHQDKTTQKWGRRTKMSAPVIYKTLRKSGLSAKHAVIGTAMSYAGAVGMQVADRLNAEDRAHETQGKTPPKRSFKRVAGVVLKQSIPTAFNGTSTRQPKAGGRFMAPVLN
jgi:hypothetical protein